jgi:hypothetical protein
VASTRWADVPDIAEVSFYIVDFNSGLDEFRLVGLALKLNILSYQSNSIKLCNWHQFFNLVAEEELQSDSKMASFFNI